MKKLFTFFISVSILWTCSGLVFAHHGTGISYGTDHPAVTLKGTVTEVRWTNPHCSIFIDVKEGVDRAVAVAPVGKLHEKPQVG